MNTQYIITCSILKSKRLWHICSFSKVTFVSSKSIIIQLFFKEASIMYFGLDTLLKGTYFDKYFIIFIYYWIHHEIFQTIQLNIPITKEKVITLNYCLDSSSNLCLTAHGDGFCFFGYRMANVTLVLDHLYHNSYRHNYK